MDATEEQGSDGQTVSGSEKREDSAIESKGTDNTRIEIFPPKHQTQKNGNQSSENTQDSPQPWKNLRLNPMFVEWLMGWTLDYTGLTDSEYLETESYLSRQRMHLQFLLEDSKLKF